VRQVTNVWLVSPPTSLDPVHILWSVVCIYSHTVYCALHRITDNWVKLHKQTHGMGWWLLSWGESVARDQCGTLGQGQGNVAHVGQSWGENVYCVQASNMQIKHVWDMTRVLNRTTTTLAACSRFYKHNVCFELNRSDRSSRHGDKHTYNTETTPQLEESSKIT